MSRSPTDFKYRVVLLSRHARQEATHGRTLETRLEILDIETFVNDSTPGNFDMVPPGATNAFVTVLDDICPLDFPSLPLSTIQIKNIVDSEVDRIWKTNQPFPYRLGVESGDAAL